MDPESGNFIFYQLKYLSIDKLIYMLPDTLDVFSFIIYFPHHGKKYDVEIEKKTEHVFCVNGLLDI